MTADEDRKTAQAPQLPEVEESELCTLLTQATEESMKKSLSVIGFMSRQEVNQRSKKTGNNYLHLLMQSCSDLGTNGVSTVACVPVLYRLAMHGIDVNTRNMAGNTCLHLACIKPYCEILWEHLIRVGVDPSLPNNHNCTVIHYYEGRLCYQVKDQPDAGTGIWCAVEKEDYQTVEQYLRAWVRPSVRRNNKSMKELCDATGNTRVKALLFKYDWINELVCAALACDTEEVKKIAKDHSVHPNISDESYVVPKPLVISVEELGDISRSTVEALRELGADNDISYQADLKKFEESFEKSEFYLLLRECTRQSLTQALNLLHQEKVNLRLRSCHPDTKGWTLLHLLADQYFKTDDYVCQRIMTRCVYKLALLGINVNVKDASGQTCLHRAFKLDDQTLARHFITIGVDPALASPDGTCLVVENYLHKGRLTVANRCRRKDIPGVWVAVEDNDVAKATKAVQSWTRVKCRKNGRYLKELAKSKGYMEVHKKLEEHEHTNDFVIATFACDLYKMKMLVALGKRLCNVNPIDPHYLAGFKPDLSGEYVPRPLIIPAIECCTADVVDFLIRFGADLSGHYAECAPCGPTAFWAFKDEIDSEVSLVVSRYADVSLRDELGQTMLHKIVLRKPDKLKEEMISTLLDRKIYIGSRDVDGFTARDYLEAMNTDFSKTLIQLIDEHLVHKITNEEYHSVETLILESYDHVIDIKGHQRKKEARMLPARELAYLSNLQEMVEMLDAYQSTTEKVKSLQNAVKENDIKFLAKNSGEVRLLQCKDRYGRTLLHLAILYDRVPLVKFLLDQCPDLVKEKDNLQRTPVHYAAASSIRRQIYGQLVNQAGGDPTVVDVNNLSALEYIKEMEKPTPKKQKLRGKQTFDYQVPRMLPDMLKRDKEDLVEPRTISLP
ncbi:uncharacterized protein [Watersipora subatra]|uniref:uncharacterized protein n=1 Tax=Watersipora subatra TaxID=2589382 RepID=UPI00355C6067